MLPLPSPAAAALLAYLPEYPTLGESVGFQLNGLIVVMMALCSIWGTLELIGLYFKRVDRLARAAAPAAPATLAATASASAAGLSPETIAVVAAAIHATLGARFRIHAVTPAELPVDWAREGRREIFASHRVR